jgi:hypothetical protein
MANRLSIPDAIDQVGRRLQQQYGDSPIPKEEIVNEVVRLTGWSSGSVMPRDFCYNLTNRGARPVEYCVFLQEGYGFRYVGRNYSATRIV